MRLDVQADGLSLTRDIHIAFKGHSSVMDVGNRILAHLGVRERAALLALARPVAFPRGSTLLENGKLGSCLFIRNGAVSILLTPSGQSAVEVGVVGSDGMLGLSAVLGVDSIEHQAVTFTGCDAFAIEPSALRGAARRYPEIDRALLRYANLRLVEAMRLSACHLRHQLEPRLAAWTITMSDLVHSLEIAVTHKQLSSLLGVTRPSVTAGLQILEGQQAIWSRRGLLAIRNRDVLESLSCGCYRHRQGHPS